MLVVYLGLIKMMTRASYKRNTLSSLQRFLRSKEKTGLISNVNNRNSAPYSPFKVN